jgi:hypothetical protein
MSIESKEVEMTDTTTYRSATPQPALPAFPGRWATGISMLVAPIVLAVMCLLASGIYKYFGRPFLSAMAAQPVITEIFLNVVPLAIFLLMLAAVGLAGATRGTAPRLSDLGGGAALLGLCGPIFFVAIEFSGFQLSSPKYLAAGAYMYDQANMVPRISLNISGPAIILAFILLAVAARKAGLMGRFRAVCLAATGLLPFGFIGAFLPISALGFVGCAIALAPLGLRWLRAGSPSPAPDPAVAGAATLGTLPGKITNG